MLTLKPFYLTINTRKAVSTIVKPHPYNDWKDRYAVNIAFLDVFIAVSRAYLSGKLYPNPYIKISVFCKAFYFQRCNRPTLYATLIIDTGFGGM